MNKNKVVVLGMIDNAGKITHTIGQRNVEGHRDVPVAVKGISGDTVKFDVSKPDHLEKIAIFMNNITNVSGYIPNFQEFKPVEVEVPVLKFSVFGK